MYFLGWILSLFLVLPSNVPELESQDYILNKVNKLRESGCYCGSKYMKPVRPLKWNDQLYSSALSHAKEMNRYRFFSHFSVDGKDIGERLTEAGYAWQIVGENLGEGQRNFDEVLIDWKKSKEHCIMLMDPRVTEMGVAKYRRFWVQHFGKPLPPGYVIRKRKY